MPGFSHTIVADSAAAFCMSLLAPVPFSLSQAFVVQPPGWCSLAEIGEACIQPLPEADGT